MTAATGLFSVVANVMRPPPALRTWTLAVAVVRLHMSTDSTRSVALTSRIGRLGSWPTGMALIPDAVFANKFAPSAELMIFDVIGSGNRSPRSGVRLDERKI